MLCYSRPLLITTTLTDFYYVFGVDTEDTVQMRLWSGWDWQPADGSWPLGNVSDPYPEKAEKAFNSDSQRVFIGFEL